MPISGGTHGFQVAPYYHTVLVPNGTLFVPPARVVIQSVVWTGVAIVATNQIMFTSPTGNIDDIWDNQITGTALGMKGPHHCEGTDTRYFNNSGVGRTVHAWGLQYG